MSVTVRTTVSVGAELTTPTDMELETVAPGLVTVMRPVCAVATSAAVNVTVMEVVLRTVALRLAPFHCESMRWVMRKEWEIACNWKIYVDNYLEGYHVPVVHPGLHKELDYDQYVVEPRRYFSIQHAPLRPVESPVAERRYDPSAAKVPEAVYAWLFPNMMLNVYLGQMQTNVVLPLGHDRCKVVFEWYADRPPANAATDPSWTKLVAFSDEIQDEDIEICEIVQRNLRSRVYDRGRYSAKRENGVHHFHSLLHEFLT